MARNTQKRGPKKVSGARRRAARPQRPQIKDARRQLRLHADQDALIQAGADKATGGNFTAFLEIAALEKISRMRARHVGATESEVVFPAPDGLAQMRHLDEPLKTALRALNALSCRMETQKSYLADADLQEEMVEACLRLVRATYKNPPQPVEKGRGQKRN